MSLLKRLARLLRNPCVRPFYLLLPLFLLWILAAGHLTGLPLGIAGLLVITALSVWLVVLQHRLCRETDRAEQMTQFAQIVEQSPTSIVVTDPGGVIEYVNPQFEQITGYTAHELVGKRPSILKSGAHKTEFYQGLWARINAGRVWQGEFQNRRKDGTIYWESAIIAPVLDSSGTISHLIGIKTDISARKEALERLNFYATMDEMTMTMNRRSGLAHLERQMKLALRHHYPLTVVYADINNLKEVNDVHGHPAGDRLIQRVVELLRQEIRDSDSIVRMGGDEFLVVLPHTDEEQAEAVMQRVLGEMNRINALGSEIFPISFSYGVTEMEQNEQRDPELSHLIAEADRRMYEQKNIFHGKV